MQAVQVLIVGSDPLARGGLRHLLEAEPLLEVAGEAPAGRGVPGVAPPGVDVVAWDTGREEGFGEAVELAVEAGLPVLALLADPSQAREARGAGALGLLARGAPGARIAAALRAVAEGLWVLDAELGESLLSRGASGSPSEPFTPRELEVLALLGEGLSNKGIAARLGITERTAKSHASAILAKLGVESRAEAIVRAARLGLVVL